MTGTAPVAAPPIPHTFLEYLRSFGPGIVIVLTWLGAGDVVDMSTAGANYGYSLLWVFVVAVLMRFLFVSLIARYQLCNQHREGVLDGLVRLHPAYAPILFVAAVVMGHVYGSYMTRGIGEVSRNMFGFGAIWQWALAWNGLALYLVFRQSFRALELIFLFFLAVLSVSFLGCAIWVGFDPRDVARGLVSVELPGRQGVYDPWRVALAMIGAVGGSLMNLVYPYFLDAKGWRGPEYRRVQLYDFIVAVTAMLVLNLAVWVLGAELLYPDRKIEHLEDLPNLLSHVLGASGRILFYAGIFAAVYTSVIGHAAGLGALGTHAWLRMRAHAVPPGADFRQHPCYRLIAISCLLPPLIWTLPGMPGFVALTLAANSAQVILLPMLAGGLWWITASERLIGPDYRNRWWENAVMAILFSLATYFAVQAVRDLLPSA
jgi:Mn2+/Fe2+ NRAMP family transporter